MNIHADHRSDYMMEDESWFNLAVAVLATWRITHLLANEDGPADLIARLRKLAGDSAVGRLMDCFLCLSLWTAAPSALLIERRPWQWLLTWLAVSGGACLLERIATTPINIRPAD